MSKFQWAMLALSALWLTIVIVLLVDLDSERSKRIELEAQLDNLAYQLEDDVIGFLITKMPDSVGLNIYGLTLTYSLEGDSKIREITFMDSSEVAE